MITLTFDQTNELLDQAVAERGADYVYDNHIAGFGACLYVHHAESDHPEAGCIVGYVLNKAGVPFELLSAREGVVAATVIDRLIDIRVLNIDNESVELLDDVQARQDSKVPWGEAVDYARDYLKEERS